AQVMAADQRAEAGVGDSVGRLERLAARQSGRNVWPRGRRELRLDRRDAERALQEALRVRPELVADALGVPDHDLLPADPVLVVVVSIGDRGLPVQGRTGQDQLEPGRA